MPKNSIRLLQAEQGSQLVIEGKEIDDETLKTCINKLSTEDLRRIQVITISNSPVTDASINILLTKTTQLASLTLIDTLITDGTKLNLSDSTHLKIMNTPPLILCLQQCGIYHHQNRFAKNWQTPSPQIKMHR